MDIVLSICLGVGLAAACGFRVFIPCLIVGIAERLGMPGLDGMPDWVSSWPALIALGVATLVEVVAYYFPWLDNALDAITTPLALVAGTLLFAGANDELPAMWRWGLAIVAGGGSAGVSQATTVVGRAMSSAVSAGFANFIVATGEWIGAVVITLLVLLIAPIAVALLIACGVMLVRLLRRRRVAPAPARA